MNKPSDTIIEAVAPSRDINGVAISDGYSVRNVAHAETRDTLRLPRSGPHDVTLVAVKRYYDGTNGGEAGHYAMIWVEFRAEGSRWRTAGVKVRAEEAGRIARDMLKGKVSKPGRGEPPRVGGKTVANDESQLQGAPLAEFGAIGLYAIFVGHRNRAGAWVRTRGVELYPPEWPIVAAFLKNLTKEAA